MLGKMVTPSSQCKQETIFNDSVTLSYI